MRMNPHYQYLARRFDDGAQPHYHQSAKDLYQILYFEAHDKFIYGITDRLQQPGFLPCKKNQNVFVKSFCANSCDGLISVLDDMCGTDFDWGDLQLLIVEN